MRASESRLPRDLVYPCARAARVFTERETRANNSERVIQHGRAELMP